jgi:hypothetical protein
MVISSLRMAKGVAVAQVVFAVSGTLGWLTLGPEHHILFAREEVALVAWSAAAVSFNRRFGLRIVGVLDLLYGILQWVAFENPDFRGDSTDKILPGLFAVLALVLSAGAAAASWREASETFEKEQP